MTTPNFHLKRFYYNVDPELRIIHAFRNCRDLKIALKYDYSYEIKVVTEDDAERLDRLVDDGFKICHACYGRELTLSRIDKRRPRPGFLYQPPGYRPPPPRPPSRKKRQGVRET